MWHTSYENERKAKQNNGIVIVMDHGRIKNTSMCAYVKFTCMCTYVQKAFPESDVSEIACRTEVRNIIYINIDRFTYVSYFLGAGWRMTIKLFCFLNS